MARPSTIDSQEILEVARRLFMERGHGVTTAEIAKEAGISEGSIFRRFHTKQRLLLAAMGLEQWEWLDRVASFVGQGSVAENIATMLQLGIAAFNETMPRMMMLWAAKDVSPAELHSCPDSPPRLALRALSGYFEQEGALGRIESPDPEIPARMLMGAIANYVFVKMMGLQASRPLAAADYAQAVARTLCCGLSPRPATAEPAARRKEQP